MSIEFPQGLGEITYEYDYFAGSQVLVFAEEILLDDCARIAWSTQQERTPIYGYASQYFNALGDGNVLVTGALWIIFKEAAYMPIILNWINSRRNEEEVFYASPAVSPQSGTIFASSLIGSASEWGSGLGEGNTREAGRVQRANIERLVEAADADPENADVQRELQGLVRQLGALGDRQFEDMAEEFEDALWYGVNDNAGRSSVLTENLRFGQDTFTFQSHRRVDQFPPIDLLVTFGDINNPAANHTLHRILDVTFVNTEFGGIESSGEPIYVRYDFVARTTV